MNKIYFRPINSSVSESMKHVREFDNLEELLDFLVQYYSFKGRTMFEREHIVIEYEGFNNQNHWETYTLSTKKTGQQINHNPQLIGYMTIK